MHPDLKEQNVDFHLPESQARPKRWIYKASRPMAIFSILAVLWTLQSYGKAHRGLQPTPADKEFRWDLITPTKQLIYHPCFDDYECARLEVPMDWNRTEGQGATVALAVIRLPAKVAVTDVRYGGPVILNPGGPGGSGVSLAFREGRKIQKIVDFEESPEHPASQSPGAQYFDVISFDPRGVNNTTPPFSCFANAEARRAWQLQLDTEGTLGSSDAAFNNLWARAIAFGDTCSSFSTGSGDSEWIGRFMSTPPVVADMVELVERHGEWREKETDRLLMSRRMSPPAQKKRDARLRNKWQKGEEKLLYWGFSYGSVLGATFAAMQPGRIKRLVIDGVCDSKDYYAGNWLLNLQDSDSGLQKFFEYCHEAGPGSCPFALDTLQGTREQYYDILIEIAKNPVAVPGSFTRGPDIITYSDVYTMVVQSLYSPMDMFSSMAQLLVDISQHNGSSFADFKANNRKSNYLPGFNVEAQPGILCTDGEDIHGITKEEYREYWHTLQNQSQALGNLWPTVRLPCAGWNVRPEWPFSGRLSPTCTVILLGSNYSLIKVHLFKTRHILYS
ncbi:TAP-like protein-domain-containing protein [Penicillium verhagenii]|nr:TAP-like protein-domain-containing protein [Penicillium verhagenii]